MKTTKYVSGPLEEGISRPVHPQMWYDSMVAPTGFVRGEKERSAFRSERIVRSGPYAALHEETGLVGTRNTRDRRLTEDGGIDYA